MLKIFHGPSKNPLIPPSTYLMYCPYLKGKVFQGKVFQKVRLRKLNKKQFQLINNDIFVVSDGVFEAFVSIPYDLTMDNDECIHSVKQSNIRLNKRILILLFYLKN